MINIEEAVTAKFPQLAGTPVRLRKPAFNFLRQLIHENEINEFIAGNSDVDGFEWIDRVFDYLNFSYAVSARDRTNIPAFGRVIIIANHPIGSLDGLALLKLVGEVRSDVKIIANDMLSHFSALNRFLIPIDNMGDSNALRSYRQVVTELEKDRAVIIFPAGEVSRATALGVRDAEWRAGFLHFARKTRAPVLPVFVKARNSLLFYGASMLFRPFSTALLSDEMFKHQHSVLRFHIGETIPAMRLESEELQDHTVVQRLRNHLYKLSRPRHAIFETERSIAHPENPQQMQKELRNGELLGVTRDNNAIILFDWQPDSAVIREIGRLRELAFRKVGEGSGKHRDLDHYDRHYRHLILWDRDNLEIAGAYRLGEGAALLERFGETGFYTNSLYHFHSAFRPYLQHGVELGRNFVNPKYWGKASLDYLWQGLGAYLLKNRDVHYLFGPVSMSANYPRALAEELAFYFSKYYAAPEPLVRARHEFETSTSHHLKLCLKYARHDRASGFTLLQETFAATGHKVPVMYRQYAALFDEGGVKALQFSVDPDFSDCVDGLCLTDIRLLKSSKRIRYIPGGGNMDIIQAVGGSVA